MANLIVMAVEFGAALSKKWRRHSKQRAEASKRQEAGTPRVVGSKKLHQIAIASGTNKVVPDFEQR